MNKKSWLDFLFYKIGEQKYDFYLSGLWKNKGVTQSTKWKRFSECVFLIDYNETCEDWKAKKFFDGINQRQILPCEIVLDLESKSNLNKIIQKLQKLKLNFYVFDTKSHGVHIHIFFSKDLNHKEKEKVISHFGADMQKASEKTMIALEFSKHWKSNKLKELIKWN